MKINKRSNTHELWGEWPLNNSNESLLKAYTVTCSEVSALTPAVAAPPNPPTAAVGVIMCYCLSLCVVPFPFTADTQAAMCPNVTVVQSWFKIQHHQQMNVAHICTTILAGVCHHLQGQSNCVRATMDFVLDSSVKLVPQRHSVVCTIAQCICIAASFNISWYTRWVNKCVMCKKSLMSPILQIPSNWKKMFSICQLTVLVLQPQRLAGELRGAFSS